MELLRPFFPSESLLKLEFLIDEKKTGLDSLLKEASISFELNKIPTAKFTFISQQLTIDPKEKLPTDIFSVIGDQVLNYSLNTDIHSSLNKTRNDKALQSAACSNHK